MEKKNVDPVAPIVVSLGKKSKKKIKRLKRGEGKMVLEVQMAVDEVRAQLPEAERGKQLVPVVLVVERKRYDKSNFPMSPFSMMK